MLEEIYKKLQTLEIPVAYFIFDKPQKLPFCIYYENGTEISGADGKNLVRRTWYMIELYTEKKLPQLERKIENLFSDVEIEKTEDIYIESERMFKISFEFMYIEKIKEDY